MNTDEPFSIATGILKLQIKTSHIKTLPWNGTFKSNEMTNTVLLTHIPDIKDQFRSSNNRIHKLLHQIHLMFIDPKFAEGKFKWIEQFPNQAAKTALTKQLEPVEWRR